MCELLVAGFFSRNTEVNGALFDQIETGQNMQIFEEVLFFKLHTTKKQTVNSTYLVLVGCGRLVEGKGHKTGFFYLFVFKSCILHHYKVKGKSLVTTIWKS